MLWMLDACLLPCFGQLRLVARCSFQPNILLYLASDIIIINRLQWIILFSCFTVLLELQQRSAASSSVAPL
jgi:hypothetical protein